MKPLLSTAVKLPVRQGENPGTNLSVIFWHWGTGQKFSTCGKPSGTGTSVKTNIQKKTNEIHYYESIT